MSNNTGNTTAFIEAQKYSGLILENLPEFILPEGMYRDVSDFPNGTTLNIKTVGTVTIQDTDEDNVLTSTPIDTSTITMSITDYVGDRWHVTDKLRQDGVQIDTLAGMRAQESSRALAEDHQTKYFAAANNAQTGADLNLVNGRPHRWVAGGAAATSRNMSLDDFISMKLAFDKANVPQVGRVCFVDPVVEATLNSLTNLVNVSNNPMFEGIVTSGFEKSHKFIRNIFGFDIWTSNMLPKLTATEVIDASTYGLASDTAEIGDVANVFACIADDTVKPIMHAWRQMPSVEGWRNGEEKRDEFQATSRFGFGTQRKDTLGVIITSATTF